LKGRADCVPASLVDGFLGTPIRTVNIPEGGYFPFTASRFDVIRVVLVSGTSSVGEKFVSLHVIELDKLLNLIFTNESH
jgi:hypothetical protein